MKTVGEVLRATRKKQGQDIEAVSDALKIRVKYLIALETDDYSVFASPVYSKGFLKNYAKYLGLDEAEILALYRRGYPAETRNKEKENLLRLGEKREFRNIKFALRPEYIVGLFTAFVVIAILLYLFFEYSSFLAPPSLTVTAPTENQVVNSNSLTITGETEPGNKVIVDGVQVPYISDNGSFSFPVTLQSGLNALQISSENSLNRMKTVKRDVIYDAGQSLSVTSTGEPSTAEPVMHVRLVIAKDSTFVEMIGDGTTLVNAVLPAGTIQTYTVNRQLYIETGRSADTTVSVNGTNILLSGSGVVSKTITIDSGGNISSK